MQESDYQQLAKLIKEGQIKLQYINPDYNYEDKEEKIKTPGWISPDHSRSDNGSYHKSNVLEIYLRQLYTNNTIPREKQLIMKRFRII